MLKTLQGGRGLAALAVVAFHLSFTMGLTKYGGQATFWWLTWRGDLGVDFFFVLSGFIILHAHIGDIGQPSAWTTYAFKRLVRVYPIYWLYTAIMVALVAAGLGTVAKLPTPPQAWASDLTLIRFSSEAPPLHQAWTLFHEIFFYALFSLAIVNRKLGFAVFGAWALVCAALYHYPDEFHRTPVSVYSAAYNLNFFMGMGAYLLYRKGVARWGVAALGALMVLVNLFVERAGLPTSPLIYAVGFGAILAGLATVENLTGLNVPPLFTLLGNASYTIYLSHEVVEGQVLKIVLKAHLDHFLHREGVYVVVFLVTAAIGVAAYLFVEKPVVKGLRRFAPKRATNQEAVIVTV
jgi:peptidoglycan/LPS O-acetylase OafA/YrhL